MNEPSAEVKATTDAVSALPSGEPTEPADGDGHDGPAPDFTHERTRNGQAADQHKHSAAALLSSVPRRADTLLAHLHRCAQSRAGADVVLLFLTYASRLGGCVLDGVGHAILHRSARRLVAAAYRLPPSTTVLLSSSLPAPSPVAAATLRLAGRLNALSAMLSEWRTMGRLWGLLGLYFSARKMVAAAAGRGRQKDKEEDAGAAARPRFDTAVAAAQLASLISFQAAENVAFLAGRKVLGLEPARQRRLAVWAVRSWMAYVFLELGRLLVERARRRAAADGNAQDSQAWADEWTTSFARNLSWAPLTVHWSMQDGPLSELAVCLLALYPATGSMRDLWRSTAA